MREAVDLLVSAMGTRTTQIRRRPRRILFEGKGHHRGALASRSAR